MLDGINKTLSTRGKALNDQLAFQLEFPIWSKAVFKTNTRKRIYRNLPITQTQLFTRAQVC